MSIWFATPSIEDANRRMLPVLGGQLGILFTQFGDDFLRGTMPVEPRTHQPMGILHGGASVVLAEDYRELLGINTVDQLREAEQVWHTMHGDAAGGR